MSSATVRLDHVALRETLRQLFGLPAGSVIDADQLLAPPAIPFMTLRLESSSLLGKVRREFSASGEQESLLASCESIFRLTWHGPRRTSTCRMPAACCSQAMPASACAC